jgi:tetratricopeptide (TPR) repeat protein
VSPTASRDSAGIALAGMTGLEVSATTDAFYVSDNRARRDKNRWLARAEGSRIGARGPRPQVVHAFERKLDDAMQRCARHVAATHSGSGRVSIKILLGFDANARLVDARIADTSDRPSALLDCTRYWLHELAGDGYDTRARDVAPSLERRRGYRVEYQQGPGPAPSGWRSPDVIAHAAELAFEQESGTIGWAKFIDEDIAAGLIDEALDVAWIWHHARPVDILPYVSLGRALTASGKPDEAARAYGSLIDIQPMRAETRRFAGALLESVGTKEALALAIDSYRKARVLRPDHPVGYQALALALARHGEHREAVDVLVDALGRSYADDRFGDVLELMRRDLATLAAAAILADPDSRSDVLTQLVDTMIVPQACPRDWITLSWETDASHLSLNVLDVEGRTHEGAELTRSVATGFGPQAFEWSSEITGPLRPWVQAYELGPEGMAMGCLRRVRFDGEHQLEFDTRPFVIWPGQQRVSFGELEHKPRLAVRD